VSKRSFRWEHLALSAVLAMSLLSLGYYCYENLGVKKPLEKAISSDPDVLWVRIDDRGGQTVLEVALGPVSDLSQTYTRLYNTAGRFLDAEELDLRIADKRDPHLEELYKAIHYYLEEASIRGNFGTMIEKCREILEADQSVDYDVTVDHERIYVQMVKGENYLYEVIARVKDGRGGAEQ